jgi:putative membrane protein
MERFGAYCPGLFNGSGFFMNPWGIVIGVLAVAVVAVLVVVLVKALRKKGGSNEDEALGLLKTRYATGEITEEEYLKKKQILGK